MGKRASQGCGVNFPGIRQCELPNSKLSLSWARAPSPCCSLLSVGLRVRGNLGRHFPKRLSYPAPGRQRRPDSAAQITFLLDSKDRENNAAGFLTRHRALLQLHPGVPEAPGRLIGNLGEGPEYTSGETNLCLARPGHSRDSRALELALPSPKCALRINYLPEIPKAGNWDIPIRDKVKPRTVRFSRVLRTGGGVAPHPGPAALYLELFR